MTHNNDLVISELSNKTYNYTIPVKLYSPNSKQEAEEIVRNSFPRIATNAMVAELVHIIWGTNRFVTDSIIDPSDWNNEQYFIHDRVQHALNSVMERPKLWTSISHLNV